MSVDKTTQDAVSSAVELNEGQLDTAVGGVIAASEPPDPVLPVAGEPPDPIRVFRTR